LAVTEFQTGKTQARHRGALVGIAVGEEMAEGVDVTLIDECRVKACLPDAVGFAVTSTREMSEQASALAATGH
jgi:hypothetical protein